MSGGGMPRRVLPILAALLLGLTSCGGQAPSEPEPSFSTSAVESAEPTQSVEPVESAQVELAETEEEVVVTQLVYL